MFFRFITFSLLLVCFTVINCSGSEALQPESILFKKYPELQKKYTGLYRTSFEYVIIKTHLQYSMSLGILRRMAKSFPEKEDVVEYVDKTINMVKEDQSSTINLLTKLKEQVANAGHVYWFEYTDGDVHETGYLVLDNGEIVFREVLVSP